MPNLASGKDGRNEEEKQKGDLSMKKAAKVEAEVGAKTANGVTWEEESKEQQGEQIESERKPTALVVARPRPRASYVQKIEEYWDQEFADNSAALSTHSDTEEKIEPVDKYSKKMIEEDKNRQQGKKPQSSTTNSKSLTEKKDYDKEQSKKRQSQNESQPKRTPSQLSDEKKLYRRSARQLRVSSIARPSVVTKGLESLGGGKEDVAGSAMSESPDSSNSNSSPQRRLPPRSIPRPPVRSSDEPSSGQTSEKDRAVMLDHAGTLIYASTGEVVPVEESENVPGAFAHVGPEGDLESTFSRSVGTATNTSNGTTTRARPRFSVTADDIEHMTPSTLTLKSEKDENALQEPISRTTASTRMVSSGEVTAATFTTLDSREGTHLEGRQDNGGDDENTNSLVNAKMVSDAEPVFYAEDVERSDLLYKNKWFLGAICFFSLGALVALVLVLIMNGNNELEKRTGDPRCWVPIEELQLPLLCYCHNTTASWVDTMGDDENQIYQFVLLNLQLEGVLDDNLNSTDVEWDQGNLYSCDPINQALLFFTTFSDSHNATREEIMRAPPAIFVDGFVLAYIYLTLGGINWTRTDGWFDTSDFCDWYGLDCLFFGHFSEFSFPRNNLQGTLPGHMLRHLKRLRILDFSGNPGLVGTIPSEIAGMANLNSLDLSNCSLTGTIPTELSSLSVLDSLELSRNGFTGTIPPELFHGDRAVDGAEDRNVRGGQLRFLHLQGNQLTGTIPSEIRYAQRLTFLRLQRNILSGTLPSELQELTFLELLNVGSNSLTGVLPEILGCLPRLGLINVYESGLREQRSGNSAVAGSAVTKPLVPESFCPQRQNQCNSTQLVDSRFVVVDCSTTTVDCSCCERFDPDFPLSRFSFFEAAVQLECADITPEMAVGFDF